MSHKAPGKAHRTGLTLAQLLHLFPDDRSAQKWFEKQRWGDEPYCSHCGSFNVRLDESHPTIESSLPREGMSKALFSAYE